MRENKIIVKKTVDYIEAHLNETIKLDDISKAVGYSKYHLNRIYAETTGQTIHKYIQERRLSESAKKLIETNQQIAEIAQDSGYTSQQSYTLAFRQYFYCTPLVYRQLRQSQLIQTKVRMFIKSDRKSYKKNKAAIYLTGKEVMAA